MELLNNIDQLVLKGLSHKIFQGVFLSSQIGLGQKLLYIFLVFLCIFLPLPPLRGQPELTCQPSWLPNQELTGPYRLERCRIRTRNCRVTVWCATNEPPHPSQMSHHIPQKLKRARFLNFLGPPLIFGTLFKFLMRYSPTRIGDSWNLQEFLQILHAHL